MMSTRRYLLPFAALAALTLAAGVQGCSEDASPAEGEGEGEEGEGEEGEGEGEGGNEGEGEGEDEWVPKAFPALSSCDLGAPDQAAFDPTVIMSALAIKKGYGFDLNGDGDVDNFFGANQLLPGVLNSFIGPALTKGDIMLLMEYQGADDAVNEECLSFNFYLGLDTDDDPATNYTGEGHFNIDSRSFGPDGVPLVAFANAAIVDGTLFAKTDAWVLTIPYDDLVISLTINNAHLQAELDGFGTITKGVLGGAVAKGTILSEVQNAGLPTEGLNIEQMLGMPDFDVDGDGCMESYSIGL